MSETTEDVELAQLAIAKTVGRARAGRFDQVSIALHWLTVLLILGQFTTAWLVEREIAWAETLLLVHRSMGVTTWGVVVARLTWRRAFAHLPPFPAGMSKLQQELAKLNEYALYLLLLVQPLTGLASLLFRGRPFALFAGQAPALLMPDKPVAHALHAVHVWGAEALLVLIGVHAGAALLHGLVLRDGVLQRMLPWTAR